MKSNATRAGWRPTPLGYAILGLLAAHPWTGYEISRLFADTPMGVHSSSPGSIYPAIKRLQAAGLVETTPHPDNPEGSKTAFAITKKGRKIFRDWLMTPVTREDVERGMRTLLLRFAFMSGNLPNAAIRRFLVDLKQEIEIYTESLVAYGKAARPAMPLTGALAFDCGIESYRTHARWAARAIEALDE